jgi:thiol-disulfide isomerase/thioredoxin
MRLYTIFAAVALGLPRTAGAQSEAGLPLGTRAPVVKVHDLEGKPVDLGQWVGRKPVFIEFWATWCPNCEELLPSIKAAQTTYGDRVEFIGVNVVVNQTPEKVRRYLTEHGISYRVLYDDEGVSTRAYLAPATSYVVILDRAGKVAYTGIGGEQKFDEALRMVVGK